MPVLVKKYQEKIMKIDGGRNPTVFKSTDGLKQTPRNALNLQAGKDFHVTFQRGEDEDKEKGRNSYTFEMVGYSGGVIANHWYWGNLAFDLSGMEVLGDKTPILFRHDDTRPMGFSTNPSVVDNQLVFTDADTTLLQNNDDVDDFLNNSSQGMPYQASVGINPSSIEFVGEGQTVEVNGQSYDNLDTVMRAWGLRECSICMFGADSNTSSSGSRSAFADDGKRVDLSDIEVKGLYQNNFSEDDMEWNEVKTKFASDLTLYAQEITEPLQGEVDKFKAKVDELTNKLGKETTKFNEVVEQRNALEKEFTIFKQTRAKDSAESMFSACCKEAGVPEKLEGKVKNQIDFSAHIDEEGVLDEDGLKKAIEAEFADWKDVFTPAAPTPKKVQGAGGKEQAAPTGKFTAEQLDDLHKSFGR